jgi:hypothetical protein
MSAPTTADNQESFEDIFQKKYDEFCEDLEGAVPELTEAIAKAKTIGPDDRVKRFHEEVLPTASPTRSTEVCPGPVLPGVCITPELWSTLSKTSQSAIQQYLTILSFCCLYNVQADVSGGMPSKAWADEFMKTWKDKLSGIDFEEFSKKLGGLFGGSGAENFKIPERFLKGHIARLAEEIVSEFKPEDFGLDEATLSGLDSNPNRAFELLMNIYTNKPEVLQNAMKRIIKRLQDKFKKGELRPEQIAAEAEELMKEFSSNNSFVELMETFRNTFGMHDMDTAREVGRENEARRNIVRERLRKKLEQKKAKNPSGGK